jgi:hypothetical protein
VAHPQADGQRDRLERISIRPGVSILSVLRHLKYTPWYALAEFVDNSVQSFLQHRPELENAEGRGFKLRVDINVDPTPPARLSVLDNAAGIYRSEFPRAFRPAAVPPDRTGLAEFGMGMKSAACWFSPKWTVRTSSLGDPFVRSIHFDIDNIINDDIQELGIDEEVAPSAHHFTEVILENVFHPPIGRTVGKLKEHLTDIYRVFIRDGLLELRFNGELLSYVEPNILIAPYFKEKGGTPKRWHKSIAVDLGGGLSVHGFAALREPASTARAGFALFRRRRLIQGSGDEGYRPVYIFGQSNSYRYQRLFGELHLEGFDVSHTKDGFRWDENEQPFLELLREHLDSEELPLLRQAEGYRSRTARAQLALAAQNAVANTAQAMEARLPNVLPGLTAAPPVEAPAEELPKQTSLAGRRFDIQFRGRAWSITVEITHEPGESQWLVHSDRPATQDEPRKIDIRLNAAHPFMVQFGQADAQELEGILRIAAAIALAELVARDSGVRGAGTVRRNVNDILREALSEP